MASTTERVRFPSSSGEVLAGIVDVPHGRVRGWGVFSHGFTLGKDSPAAARICKQLAAEGVGMLRFDNLGLGDSEGDWGDGSFSHKVADTVEVRATVLAEAWLGVLTARVHGSADDEPITADTVDDLPRMALVRLTVARRARRRVELLVLSAIGPLEDGGELR